MKLTALSFFISFAAVLVTTVESTSKLRGGVAEIEDLDRRRADQGGDSGGGDSDDGKKGGNSRHEKHGQGMVTVHGMTSHPTAADIALVEKAVVAAYGKVHPDAKWEMLEFHDTWVQVFEEENDVLVSGAASGAGDEALPVVGRNLVDLWGAMGGYWTSGCRDCHDYDDVPWRVAAGESANASIGDLLGSSAVGDEVCALLKQSGADIFQNVYDCAVSAKPAAVAVVEAMRKAHVGAATVV